VLQTPAAANIPGGRGADVVWVDHSGNVWHFGGYGFDSTGAVGYLNDLWELNPSTNEWTWMSGSSTVGTAGGQSGMYGTLGSPAASNVPGGRADPLSWIDSAGNLWLFGGYGFDSVGAESTLNDLWEFSPATNEWTWMAGSSTAGQIGSYVTAGKFSAGNIPGSRYYGTNWTDSKGNFWLFGGYGYGTSSNFGSLNDLWEFNPATNEWAWMGGSSTVASDGGGPSGVYGVLGKPAAANIPGGRAYSASWLDHSGNLWIFGGGGFDADGNFGYLNDLWKLNTSTNQWTWMSGSSTVVNNSGPPGIYGTLEEFTAGATPGGRETSTGWLDSAGNLWLSSGSGYDANDVFGSLGDLWVFNPSIDEWAWVGGSSTPGDVGQAGVYGELGTPAASNFPGSRYYVTSWNDNDGNFWLFAGLGEDLNNTGGFLNDLWEYQPPTLSTITSFVASPTAITVGASSTLTGVFSNGTGVITPGNISVTSGTGESVSPTATTTYTLTVTPTAGPAVTQTATVTVQSGKATPAALTSPKPSSTFTSNKVTFTWTAGLDVTMYDLYLGTTVGSNNLYQTGHTTALSTTATVPTNGATIYARLLSYINGAWQFNDYTFTEGSMAVLTSPVQGSTLTGASVTFKWTTGTNATDYDLYVGSTGVGSNNVYQTGHITTTSTTATNLPTTGATLYVRLLSLINGSWQYLDYTFTEAMPAGTPAALTSPANGATLGASNVTFNWTSGTDVTEYDLYLGTTGVGSNNLYQTGHVTTMTTTVPKIPSSGATVYARLLSLINGTWQYKDYTFTEP
jgi:N-acetylneuraminic acid mutarotase